MASAQLVYLVIDWRLVLKCGIQMVSSVEQLRICGSYKMAGASLLH
jgi:hypothetical protein